MAALNYRRHLMSLPGALSGAVDSYLDLVLDYSEASEGDYTEDHHVLPRSLFPTLANEASNLVTLRGRDHLTAHFLLVRALPETPEMANAFLLMLRRDAIPANKKLARGARLGDADIPVPTEDMLRQYEVSRYLWSEHMKTRLTIRVRETGEVVQIPREVYDSEVHAHLSEGSALYRDVTTGEARQLRPDHPDVLAGLVRPFNSGMTRALRRDTGESVYISSKEFQENPETFTTERKGGSHDWKANLGCVPVKTREGVFLWAPKGSATDAKLASGDYRPHNKGQVTVRDAEGNVFNVSVGDPRLLSGEVRHCSKGKTTVRDSSGRAFQVAMDDPRVASGELVQQNTGRLRVVDAQGVESRVFPDDPRLASGELRLKVLKKDQKIIKVRAWDATGKEGRFYPDDPRLAGLYRSKKEVPGWSDPRKGRPRKPKVIDTLR